MTRCCAPAVLLLAVAFLVPQVLCVTSGECDAVYSIYRYGAGSKWTNSRGWQSGNTTECCSWFGLDCDFFDDVLQITKIELTRNNLVGTLPPNFDVLPYIQRLDFSENEGLSGSLPESISTLTSLESLSIRSTSIYSLPKSLSRLSKLSELNAQHASLHGQIGDQICTLSNLASLDLSMNLLSGPIPGCIGHLKNLNNLDLSDNELSGAIPSGLVDLRNLIFLELSSNKLTGKLPANFGMLSSLGVANVFGNKLSGQIDWVELGKIKQLSSADFSNNDFEGGFEGLETLLALEELSLEYNSFTGPLPQGSMQSLRTINAHDNLIAGPIPDAFFTAALNQVNLARNRLTGSVPATIANATTLMGITLEDNLLTGFPSVYPPEALATFGCQCNIEMNPLACPGPPCYAGSLCYCCGLDSYYPKHC